MFRKILENLGFVQPKRRKLVLPYDHAQRHREEVQGWLDHLGVKVEQRSDPSIPVPNRPNDLFDADLAASRQYSMDRKNPRAGIENNAQGLGAQPAGRNDGRGMMDFLRDGFVPPPDRDRG
jgi:hypothetical protein